MKAKVEHAFAASDWHAALQASEPALPHSSASDLPFTVNHFTRTPANIVQPSLMDDIFCLHLGGAKRVYRVRDGVAEIFDVPLNAMTIMPRHRAAAWRTEGPIDYVHVTLRPKPLDALITSELGKTRGEITFRDTVGFVNPLLATLARELLQVESATDVGRLYTDTLFVAFTLALLRYCSNEAVVPALTSHASGRVKGGLPGRRLRSVIDFLASNRHKDIALDELAQVAGLSRAQFFRAFRQSTGTTPSRYLERLRIEDARRGIEHGGTLEVVAAQAGFPSVHALRRAFRRVMQLTPESYRRWYK